MLIGCSVIRTSMGASRRSHDQSRRRTDVQADDGSLIDARLPEGVPVRVVKARELQVRRVLGERDRVASLRGVAPHLGRHRLRVPDRREHERDEPAGRASAPLVDVPVVVRLQHREPGFEIGGAAEQLSTEVRERREAHRTKDTVHVHVADAVADVEAARADLLERRRLHPVLVGWSAGNGVEPDVRDLVAVVDPDVAAVVAAHDVRGNVVPARGQVPLEHVRWLDDMIVDADHDHLVDPHACPLTRDPRTSSWATAAAQG